MPTQPRYPLYIPSKSRAEIALTPKVLDAMGVPYRLVVEEQQVDDYAKHYPRERLLVLDPAYQRDFDPMMELAPGQSPGSGPARNFIWDHSISEGYAFHWIMDDNIRLFARLHRNERIPCGDGTPFVVMEDFVDRYTNVAMAGPQYWMSAPSRKPWPPYVTNTRIYSCNLIRNDLPFRWRGRYNEDTILSLDMLKAGWTTVLFNAFLQYKITTQKLPGGNTEAFYAAEGTLPKSRMIVDAHPDVARILWRFRRWHHYVDYSGFTQPLRRQPDLVLPTGDPYRLRKVEAPQR